MSKGTYFRDEKDEELLYSIAFKNRVEHMTDEQFYSKYNMLISSGLMTSLGEEVQRFLYDEESRRRSKGPEQG